MYLQSKVRSGSIWKEYGNIWQQIDDSGMPPRVTAVSMNYLFHLFYAVDNVRETTRELVRDVLLVSLTEWRI